MFWVVFPLFVSCSYESSRACFTLQWVASLFLVVLLGAFCLCLHCSLFFVWTVFVLLVASLRGHDVFAIACFPQAEGLFSFIFGGIRFSLFCIFCFFFSFSFFAFSFSCGFNVSNPGARMLCRSYLGRWPDIALPTPFTELGCIPVVSLSWVETTAFVSL